MKTKQYYSVLLKQKLMEPDVLNIWQRTLSLPSDFDWNPVLVFKFCEIKDNKIKQFNFKFLHKLLPSRMNLHVCKWKIKNDYNCEICHMLETTQHMMLDCKNIKLFWKIISRIIYYVYDIEIHINENILLTGYIEEKKNTQILFAESYKLCGICHIYIGIMEKIKE